MNANVGIIKQSENIRSEPLWQDRDIRFDASLKDLQLRKGERIVKVFDSIEDTKGNSGDEGKLTITSIRLIWQSKTKPRINLTIGFNCITSVTSRTLHNKLRGKYDALYLMTKVGGTRYEFIFTRFEREGMTVIESDGLTTALQITHLLSRVCRAYSCTKPFRDLKLRSTLVTLQGKQLKILPSEQIYNKINGVWNLSSDQGNLGTMHITNIRIVWHANMNELFNLSLPYIQINCIRIRESKFGIALVIESSEATGGYVLGFRLDPIERLHSVYNELINLYSVHANNPNLGVEAFLSVDGEARKFDDIEYDKQPSAVTSIDQNEFLDEVKESNPDVIASYLAENSTSIENDNQPIYCSQLGLAIEKIKDGFTLESLWNVVPTN
ncbi:DUF1448 domain containing protein-like protein [Dinothrombium tinctorium]|uniref:DUF1448 domain containing protein-like protein n=1 Tax=Dinothrombium tinctorium TaxID=1965070 RepID=A0A443RG97_9ACAR|nr:DUF1448 domain containing protein-like protein [Dinothrombium tinctorium]